MDSNGFENVRVDKSKVIVQHDRRRASVQERRTFRFEHGNGVSVACRTRKERFIILFLTDVVRNACKITAPHIAVPVKRTHFFGKIRHANGMLITRRRKRRLRVPLNIFYQRFNFVIRI